MAESTTIRVKRDGQILILDNGGVNTHTIAYEPGDFNYTVPDYAVNLFLDRGVIGATPSIRPGDEAPMTLGFSAYMRDLGDTTGAAYATLLDILHRYAAGYVATTWVSTMGATHDVFTVTVSLTIDGSIAGEADKTVTFPFCVLRGDVAEGDPNTITVNGTSYSVRPTLS